MSGFSAPAADVTAADVILPTAEQSSRELRIRCVVRPDQAQKQLDRPGLRLPERLRPPHGTG